ncbi:MAG: MFS transporter, partial [Deltaproteobacteria bacterium]|nr:MFS transporter [Deltaproteobacteria bacterium]
MNSSLVVRLYSVHSLLSKLFFFLPIIVIWFRDQGFSQFQVTLIMGSFFLSATVAEIPSGIFSDKYGYRWALFITGILEAIGMVLIANADHFITALIGEVLNGIGYAFYTGSKESYLFHFLTITREDGTYQKRFARAKLFEFIGMAAGGLVGGSIYIYWKELPFYLSAISFVASSLLIFYLPTVRQGASDSISSLNHLRQGIEHIRTGDQDLKTILAFYCVYLSSMLIFLVTLNQPYLRES